MTTSAPNEDEELDEIRSNWMMRMEGKIDKITDVLERLARTEERQANLISQNQLLVRAVQSVKRRVSIIEMKQATSSGKSSVIEKICWVIFAALASALSAYFVGE